MLVKSGRNEYDINKDDLFLDNGACIQLITRKAGDGWNQFAPVIGKSNWKKYLPYLELAEVKDDLKYYRLK